ncbi:MAG: ATP-binding cassette domain-containing protein [Planctomycetota bacterium]
MSDLEPDQQCDRFAIHAAGLTRYFGDQLVVDRLDFCIPKGKVTALLGLNGAGKTTTIRMAMGLLDPTRGECRTLGENSRELSTRTLQRIGYLVEGHYLPGWMRVSALERFARSGRAHWDADRFRSLIEHFRIRSDQRVGRLSRGQRAGVSLACVLAADPELLILDDPALGLDPVSRRALNEALVEFAGGTTRQGAARTVLLSTHLIDDVERIADDIAVMIGGRLLVHTSLANFTTRVGRWMLHVDESGVSARFHRELHGLVEARRACGHWELCIANGDADIKAQIARALEVGGGEANASIEQMETSLNDLVIAYLSTEGSESFREANEHVGA